MPHIRFSPSEHKIVSFDIFDTLIERECLLPFDVFFLAAMKLYGEKGMAVRFTLSRIAAEALSREGMPGRETTLDRIYEFLTWEAPAICSLKEFELSTEQEICRPKKSGIELMNKALEAQTTVVLTTDMYLPQPFIRQILTKCGICGYDRIFLSNEYGRNKSTGTLFETLKETMGVKAGEVLHIGDNIKADYLGARKAGIDSRLIMRNHFLKRLFFSKIGVAASLNLRY